MFLIQLIRTFTLTLTLTLFKTKSLWKILKKPFWVKKVDAKNSLKSTKIENVESKLILSEIRKNSFPRWSRKILIMIIMIFEIKISESCPRRKFFINESSAPAAYTRTAYARCFLGVLNLSVRQKQNDFRCTHIIQASLMSLSTWSVIVTYWIKTRLNIKGVLAC